MNYPQESKELNLWYLCSQKTLQQLWDSNILLTPPDLFKDICATMMISTENGLHSSLSLHKMITLYSKAPFVNIIHSSQFNNAVILPMKSSISCCFSHQNPPTYFLELFWFENGSRSAYFCPDSDQMTFSLNKATSKELLWIMDSYFRQKQWFGVKMDLFPTNTQLLSSPDVNWWSGVVWIICGLLWCFYQLFGLSFWRHPFTAEHPLVSKWFLKIWCRNKLIYILDGLRVSTFSANFHFWGEIFL